MDMAFGTKVYTSMNVSADTRIRIGNCLSINILYLSTNLIVQISVFVLVCHLVLGKAFVSALLVICISTSVSVRLRITAFL